MSENNCCNEEEQLQQAALHGQSRMGTGLELFLFVLLFALSWAIIYYAADLLMDGLKDLSKLMHVSLPVVGLLLIVSSCHGV